ncbi:MAG: ATP-binding protein [Porticoccaceae bacterium]
MISIRRFLTLALALPITGLLAASMAWSYRSIQHEVAEVFDAQLAQYARLLRQSADYPDTGAKTLITDIFDIPSSASGEDAQVWGHPYERNVAFQIWRDGRLSMRSASAPEQPWGASLQPGYQEVAAGSHQWRVFMLHDDNRWIAVGERMGIRAEISREMLNQGIAPVLLALLLVIGIVAAVVHYGLAPLLATAAALRSRRPDNLEPLRIERAPSEVAVVVQAINQLFERLGDARDHERAFTADAAHELRTPIAAMKIHLQNALNARGNARGDGDTAESLAEIDHLLSRTQLLIEQLLTLSRLDPDSVELPTAELALAPLIEGCWQQLAAINREPQLHLDLRGDIGATLTGNAETLAILFGNLLRNAIQYAPAGSRLTVAIKASADAILVDIIDAGPGIPVELRSRVLERFYRADTSKLHYNDGSGLGLAIVHRIADLHGARLSLDDSPMPPGLCVNLRFPVPPAMNRER